MFEHCGNIYFNLHKILRNTVYWTLGKFICTTYWGILYVEQWEYLFTQNTEEYFMLSTVGRFIYPQYWGILYVEHWEDLFTQNTEEYCMLNTVRRFIYTNYWGILYVEHYEIYLHKILGNTSCWTLWEYLFT